MWSEWIQSPDYRFTASASAKASYEKSLGSGSTTITEADFPFDTGAGWWRDQPPLLDEHVLYVGIQFGPPPGWDQPDWFPAELSEMTEGVDYAVRPDRVGSEQDAYVEYQPGDNLHVDWAMGDLGPQVIRNEGLQAVGDGAVPFVSAAWLHRDTTYAPGVGPDPLPTGADFIYFDQSFPVGSRLPVPPNPYPSTSFTLGTRIDNVAVEDNFTVGSTVRYESPVMVVRMPPWRYWIPGEPIPLRQKQRDDGLGLSTTTRWSGGTSRQASLRWKSYL